MSEFSKLVTSSHRSEIDKIFRDASISAIRRIAPLKHNTLRAMHLTDRFQAVASVIRDIERRFPEHYHLGLQVDESEIPEETEILLKISRATQLSNQYQEIVLNAVTLATSEMTENVEDVINLFPWANQSPHQWDVTM